MPFINSKSIFNVFRTALSNSYSIHKLFLTALSFNLRSLNRKTTVSLKRGYYAYNIQMALSHARAFAPINWSRFNKVYLLDILNNHVIQYPTPISLTYA
jgi:hypothetical protein